MSGKSDEESDISEVDVSEGTVANPVFASQIDQSLSEIERMKPCHKTSKTFNHQELKNHFPRVHCNFSPTPKKRKELCLLPIKFDSNSYNYTILNESPKQTYTRAVNMVAQNIKNIKLIPQPCSKRQSYKPQPPSKRSPIDVETRFYEYQRKSQEKIQKKREERDSEVEECTFHPKIDKNGRSRSFEEFYNDSLKFDEHKQKKLTEMRNEKPQENFSFKPKISAKSSFLMKTKNNRNCFDRLHATNKNQSQTKSFYLMSGMSKDFLNYMPFVPKVNKSPKDINRTEMPTNILFSESKKKKKTVNLENKPTSITTSQNSINILVKGFLNEFKKQCKRVDVDRTGKLNYTRFIDILKAMKFHRDKPTNEEIVMVLEIWEILSTSGEGSVDDLKVILMGVMGFYQPWMEFNSEFTLNPKEVAEIHEKYSKLFKNRSLLNSKFKSPDSNKLTDSSARKSKSSCGKRTMKRETNGKELELELEQKIENNSFATIHSNQLAPILEYPTFTTATNQSESQPKNDTVKPINSNDSFNSGGSDSKVVRTARRAPTRGNKRTSSLQPEMFQPLNITIAYDELINFKAEEKIMNEFVRKTLNPGILTINVNKS